MNLNYVAFLIDESKNFLGGIVNKIGLIKLNNMYYRYLDYYGLNKSICIFEKINYIAIIVPMLICLIFNLVTIIFITKSVLNFYLQKKDIVINNKRKILNYDIVDDRKSKKFK